MGLSNYQLVLLDNLIYLDTVVLYKSKKGYKIKDLINELLYAEGSNIAGTGTIEQDCKNAHSGGANCIMELEDWVKVL